MNAWMNMACFLLSDITGLIRTLKIQKGTKKCFVLPLSPPELNLLNWSILCEDPNFPGSWLSLPLYISGTCWFYFKVDTGAGLSGCPVHPLLPGFPLLQRWKRNWIPNSLRATQGHLTPSRSPLWRAFLKSKESLALFSCSHPKHRRNAYRFSSPLVTLRQGRWRRRECGTLMPSLGLHPFRHLVMSHFPVEITVVVLVIAGLHFF